MSYKQERVIVIVSEFVNDKREYYPITDVPVEKARFFYKDDDGLFKVMSSSDYAVRTETNETRLYITSEKIKSESSKFQMGYEINFSASEYETSLPVLSVLVEMYNTLVEDSKTIFNYVKKQCFISDDKTTGLILPNLPPYTVWCMGENNEMFALPVSELYDKFEQLVQSIYKKVLELLNKDYQEMQKGLEDKTVELKKSLQSFADKLEKDKKALIDDYVEKTSKKTIDNYVETTSKTTINNYIETTTKPSIDSYIETVSKPEIDNYVEKVSKIQLNNHVENVNKIELNKYTQAKKTELTVHTEGEIKRITSEGEKQREFVIEAGGGLFERIESIEECLGLIYTVDCIGSGYLGDFYLGVPNKSEKRDVLGNGFLGSFYLG